MDVGEQIARHAFAACPIFDDFLSPNTVFSPYASFLTTFYSAFMADDPNIQAAILVSLGMDPVGLDFEASLSGLFRHVTMSETWTGGSPEFREFLDFFSATKDSSLKTLAPNALNLVRRLILKSIPEHFPELSGSDDSLFERFVAFATASPNDTRLPEFTRLLEFPIGVLRGASTIECRNTFWRSSSSSSAKLDLIARKMGSDVHEVDFSGDAIAVIDDIVSKATNGTVNQIATSEFVGPGTQILLTSTVYVDLRWEIPFASVEIRPFHTPSGSAINVKCMVHQFDNLPYYEDDRVQAIELRYKNSDFTMVFIMFRSWGLDQLKFEQFEAMVLRFRRRPVYVQIPRFHVDFGPRSLRRSLPPDYASELTDVILAYSLGNYERGTSPARKPPKAKIRRCPCQFIASHSFMFYLRNSKTQTVLLMGCVTKPMSIDFDRGGTFRCGPPLDVSDGITENKDLWDRFNQIGEGAPPNTPTLPALNHESAPARPPVGEEEQKPEDLMAGLSEVRAAKKDELDRFFGIATAEKVTYPEYSPWNQVEFGPIEPDSLGGESIVEPPPAVEVDIAPLGEPDPREQKRPSPPKKVTQPKLKRPVIFMFGRSSK
jgi:hypothetical protein